MTATKPLSDLTEVITKGTTPTTLGMSFTESGIPFIKVENLRDNRVVVDQSTLFISSSTHQTLSRSKIRHGDVLVAIAGTIGRCAVVGNEYKELNCNQAVAIVRPQKELDPRFLCYWLQSEAAKRQIQKSKVTATISNLSLSELGKLHCPVIKIPEQRRIATILEKADAIRRKRRQAIDLMNDFLASVFLEMFGDPIVNDRGWDKKPLGELFPEKGQIVDGPFGSTLKPECYVPTGIRVIRNFNIKDDCFDTSGYKFITEEKFQEISRSEVRAGDLLISTKGTVGNVCEMPTLSGRSVLSASGTVRIRFAPSSAVECSFLVSQMVLPQIKKYIQSFQAGSNQKYLNLSSIRKIEIVVPPLEVQHKFLMIKRAKLLAMSKVEKAEEYASNLCSALTSQLLG